MPRVALVPTGKMEHVALARSLARVFPPAAFEVRPPTGPVNSFTSCDVTRYPDHPDPESTVRVLAAVAVAAVQPNGPRPRADFAFVVEDLELVNEFQPDRVVGLFRRAVIDHIHDSFEPGYRQEVFDSVRERCSFHLFRPMSEAYLFGDHAALTEAGAQRPAVLAPGADLEAFCAADAEYLGLPDGAALPDHHAFPSWRRAHPKAYLRYLCDPTLGDRRRAYREGRQGADALVRLDWQRVIETSPGGCPFLHALLDDLAEAVGHRPAWVQAARAAPLTRFADPVNGRVLRNI